MEDRFNQARFHLFTVQLTINRFQILPFVIDGNFFGIFVVLIVRNPTEEGNRFTHISFFEAWLNARPGGVL